MLEKYITWVKASERQLQHQLVVLAVVIYLK